MDETLDEIADRFDPDRLVDDAWAWTRNQLPDPRHAARYAQEAGAETLDAVKRHPVPAALAGFGLVWLLSEMATGRSVDGSDLGDAARSTMGGLSGASRRAARRARGAYGSAARSVQEWGGTAADDLERSRDAARSGMHEAKHRGRGAMDAVSDRANAAGDRAREAASLVNQRALDAQDRVRDAADATARSYEEHPAIFGLLALAGGLIAGLAAPNTRYEERYLGEAGRQLRRDAIDAGHVAAEATIERAADAAENAVDHVDEKLDEVAAEDEGDRERTTAGSGSAATSSAPFRAP